MTFREFFINYPEAAAAVPMVQMFLADDNYIVRIVPALGKVEIGYTGDAWEVE